MLTLIDYLLFIAAEHVDAALHFDRAVEHRANLMRVLGDESIQITAEDVPMTEPYPWTPEEAITTVAAIRVRLAREGLLASSI